MLAGIGPAWRLPRAGILDEFLKVNGKQDGPVGQQVTLGGGDLAAGDLLPEVGARPLQCRINCEHVPTSCNRHTSRGAG